jgi:cytochrome P450
LKELRKSWTEWWAENGGWKRRTSVGWSICSGIVKETMRLHPVAPMLVPRLSTQPCRIAGYDIPANTRLFVNVWTIGRDGKLWENPDKFQPERFKGSTLDVKGRDYELLPFGSGRRMCPGYSLGLKVVQIALANLIHGFQWKLPDGKSLAELVSV